MFPSASRLKSGGLACSIYGVEAGCACLGALERGNLSSAHTSGVSGLKIDLTVGAVIGSSYGLLKQ